MTHSFNLNILLFIVRTAIILVIPIILIILEIIYKYPIIYILTNNNTVYKLPLNKSVLSKEANEFVNEVINSKKKLEEIENEKNKKDFHSIADELSKYKRLLDENSISEQEYESLKNRLLNNRILFT